MDRRRTTCTLGVILPKCDLPNLTFERASFLRWGLGLEHHQVQGTEQEHVENARPNSDPTVEPVHLSKLRGAGRRGHGRRLRQFEHRPPVSAFRRTHNGVQNSQHGDVNNKCGHDPGFAEKGMVTAHRDSSNAKNQKPIYEDLTHLGDLAVNRKHPG